MSVIQEAVDRVRRMEAIFDRLLEAAGKDPAALCEDGVLREQLGILVRYYESGLWLKDYELDENGLFPQKLKRGVLSQDAVYDFLQRLKQDINT